MVHLEVIEAPQGDWWVVTDGRVVGLHLRTPRGPDPFDAAYDQAAALSESGGMTILHTGTTWRSRAFDHLEDLSCRRGTCCRMREMTDAEQEEFVRAEQAWFDGVERPLVQREQPTHLDET